MDREKRQKSKVAGEMFSRIQHGFGISSLFLLPVCRSNAHQPPASLLKEMPVNPFPCFIDTRHIKVNRPQRVPPEQHLLIKTGLLILEINKIGHSVLTQPELFNKHMFLNALALAPRNQYYSTPCCVCLF